MDAVGIKTFFGEVTAQERTRQSIIHHGLYIRSHSLTHLRFRSRLCNGIESIYRQIHT